MTLNDELQVFKTGLSSALEKLPPYKGTVRRAIDRFDEAAHLKEGDIYTPKQFLSTSKNQKWEGPYSFVIESKKGKSLTDFAIFSNVENEVLFNSDAKFKVLRTDNGKNSLGVNTKTYYMEEF